MTDFTPLYAAHVAERARTTAAALEETGFDRLLIHSGKPFTYFADDNDAPFHSTPHFAHWSPVEGPDHVLEIVPGRKPRLARVTPVDFWYAPPAPAPAFVRAEIDVIDVTTPEEAWAAIGNGHRRTAYLGPAAEAKGVSPESVNPDGLVARLDWERSYKSGYEVEALAAATARAAAGFRAAEGAFAGGGSEIEIHNAYLTAVGSLEEKLPYPTIIGLDERASTLHYHGKRGKEAAPGTVMLIDAGASVAGYGCDITRTYLRDGGDPVFRQLLDGMEALQRRLGVEARPGKAYLDVHVLAHRLITELLCAAGILTVSADEAFARKLSLPFFPHGLGHFLGIQVHDVSGRQAARTGGANPPPSDYPALRTTRVIEEGFVFTIEPGLYFIPMLLAPFRSGSDAGAFDWPLIDRLTKLGGIRIEDDVFVGKESNRNLTRASL